MNGYRILLVDDSPTYLAVSKHFLSEKNYQVFTAADQTKALEILEENKIDVLIVDWEMPQCDGISFVRVLRSGWKYFDLPIIVMTARNNPEDIITAMNAGCDDFLSKEEPMEILEARIQRLLFFLQRLKIRRRKSNKRTILVVDDSATFLTVVREFLLLHKFDVQTSLTGKDALIILEKENIDLVVVDWLMPEMDGLQLVQNIRSNEYFRETPIIMMSNKNRVDDVAKAIEMGVDDFINKDTDFRLLEKKIGVLLRIQEQHRRYTHQILEDKNRVEELVRERTKQLHQTNEDLKSTQAQLVHAEKMAAIGQMVAGVAHEINNPLGFIANNLYALEGYIGDLKQLFVAYDECRPKFTEEFSALVQIEQDIDLAFILQDFSEIIDGSRGGVERLTNIVKSLRNFSRLDEGEFKRDDITTGIESSLQILQHQIKDRIEVIKEWDNLPQIVAAHGQLNQVFINILTNAIAAIEGAGKIYIRGYSKEPYLILEFEDTGCGIQQEILGKIFDPFFTSKDVGKGTGLGLSISYGIIKKHRGEIVVNSTVGKGTTFTIKLPLEE